MDFEVDIVDDGEEFWCIISSPLRLMPRFTTDNHDLASWMHVLSVVCFGLTVPVDKGCASRVLRVLVDTAGYVDWLVPNVRSVEGLTLPRLCSLTDCEVDGGLPHLSSQLVASSPLGPVVLLLQCDSGPDPVVWRRIATTRFGTVQSGVGNSCNALA